MDKVVTVIEIMFYCNVICAIACLVMCIKMMGVSSSLKKIKKKMLYTEPDVAVNARIVKLKEQGLTGLALEYLDKELDKEFDYLLDTGIGTKHPTISIERAKGLWSNTLAEYTRYYNYLGADVPDKFKNIDIDLVVSGIWSLQ